MSSRTPLALALFAALAASPSRAQVASIVGPQSAPTGCPISISISNDTKGVVGTGVCPFVVRDASGAPIFTPICIKILQNIDPGDTFTTSWDQVDDLGQQVPAGTYVVDVQLPGGALESHKLAIGSAAAGIAPLGVPHVGTSRSYALCAPKDALFPYLMAMSGASAPGIATCGGVVPLAPDVLFAASLASPATFQSFVGLLDASGRSSAPTLAIPANPSFAGLQLVAAFVVLDPASPCIVRRVSSALLLKTT